MDQATLCDMWSQNGGKLHARICFPLQDTILQIAFITVHGSQLHILSNLSRSKIHLTA